MLEGSLIEGIVREVQYIARRRLENVCVFLLTICGAVVMGLPAIAYHLAVYWKLLPWCCQTVFTFNDVGCLKHIDAKVSWFYCACPPLCLPQASRSICGFTHVWPWLLWKSSASHTWPYFGQSAVSYHHPLFVKEQLNAGDLGACAQGLPRKRRDSYYDLENFSLAQCPSGWLLLFPCASRTLRHCSRTWKGYIKQVNAWKGWLWIGWKGSVLRKGMRHVLVITLGVLSLSFWRRLHTHLFLWSWRSMHGLAIEKTVGNEG